MKFKFIFCFLLALTAINAGPDLARFKDIKQPLLQKFGENLKEIKGHIFYPFGGPDVTYPFLMFPDLVTITLMGLEPAKILKEEATPTESVKLNNLELSNLSSLYRRSFFVTAEMSSGLKNVTTLILKQLENLGCSGITVKTIEGRENAIQFKCTYNGVERTVNYYKAGLNNDQIDIEFLKTLMPFDVIFFKAASYLPHQKNFSKFREFVLENVSTFVQDSTGVPYRDLKDNFDLTLFGKYLKPYKFPGFEQKDFRKYSEEINNTVALNFQFGYGGGFVPTNILVAKRKKVQSAT